MRAVLALLAALPLGPGCWCRRCRLSRLHLLITILPTSAAGAAAFAAAAPAAAAAVPGVAAAWLARCRGTLSLFSCCCFWGCCWHGCDGVVSSQSSCYCCRRQPRSQPRLKSQPHICWQLPELPPHLMYLLLLLLLLLGVCCGRD